MHEESRSVCLSLCVYTVGKMWTDFSEIFRVDDPWNTEEPLNSFLIECPSV